jgi:hypothetical protein
MDNGWHRRDFLKLLLGSGLGYGAAASAQFRPGGGLMLIPERPSFFFTQIVYGQGLQWNPHPTAVHSFLQILTQRTSVAAGPERVDLQLSSDRLFYSPFLFLSGSRDFAPFPDADLERLRRFLDFGGFLLVDDALGESGSGFDQSFQREFSRLYPGETLQKLPENHTIYQTYYLIDHAGSVVGRKATRPFLSGLDRENRTALVYSQNDLAGAWARDSLGQFMHQVEPGGERQREMAIRLGINLVLYALTVDYKKDLIHVPFIEERRRRKF